MENHMGDQHEIVSRSFPTLEPELIKNKLAVKIGRVVKRLLSCGFTIVQKTSD
jgi:hypothetical protein